MKVILHGYLHDTNFGDNLFAHLFYNKCKSLNLESVDFWQSKFYSIGDFCRNELGYTEHKSALSCLSADAFVLISGGSLGDDKTSQKAAIYRYLRFVLPIRLFQILRKPVYIIGVGGGPVEIKWLRWRMVKMLNKAKLIYFREEESKKYFESYGVKNKMVVTSDTAQVINADMLDELKEKKELDEFANGRKKLFVHLSENDKVNEMILKKVIPGVIKFWEKHPEYVVVTGFDNVRVVNPEERLKNLEAVKQLQQHGDVFLYNYKSSWQLCSLLNEMDCVVTQKLHIGIISASLGKSVVSFPVHREKTQRYYRQIGEAERSIHMSQVNPDVVERQLEKFHGKKITLPESIIEKARQNLDILETVLK